MSDYDDALLATQTRLAELPVPPGGAVLEAYAARRTADRRSRILLVASLLGLAVLGIGLAIFYFFAQTHDVAPLLGKAWLETGLLAIVGLGLVTLGDQHASWRWVMLATFGMVAVIPALLVVADAVQALIQPLPGAPPLGSNFGEMELRLIAGVLGACVVLVAARALKRSRDTLVPEFRGALLFAAIVISLTVFAQLSKYATIDWISTHGVIVLGLAGVGVLSVIGLLRERVWSVPLAWVYLLTQQRWIRPVNEISWVAIVLMIPVTLAVLRGAWRVLRDREAEPDPRE